MPLVDRDYITKGFGDLYVNYQKVGYLTGVRLGYTRETDTFRSGQPKQDIKKIVEGELLSLEADMAVISAANLARALGQKAVSSNNATTAVAVVDGDNDIRTVQKDRTTGKLFIFLGPGPGMGKNFAVTTLKKGSTTLVANPTADYEYTVRAADGYVEFEEGGTNSIAEGDSIDCTAYTYDKPKGQRINFGDDASIKEALIHFVHTEPNGNVTTHAVLWKGAANGEFELNFQDQWVSQNVRWEAIKDETKTENPLGYIYQVDNT